MNQSRNLWGSSKWWWFSKWGVIMLCFITVLMFCIFSDLPWIWLIFSVGAIEIAWSSIYCSSVHVCIMFPAAGKNYLDSNWPYYFWQKPAAPVSACQTLPGIQLEGLISFHKVSFYLGNTTCNKFFNDRLYERLIELLKSETSSSVEFNLALKPGIKLKSKMDHLFHQAEVVHR